MNISKGNTNFGPAMHIAGALKELFDRLAKEKLLVGRTVPAFIERAAFYLGEINAIYPFREGKGRTRGDNSQLAAIIEAALFSTRGRKEETHD